MQYYRLSIIFCPSENFHKLLKICKNIWKSEFYTINLYYKDGMKPVFDFYNHRQKVSNYNKKQLLTFKFLQL